jgi:hypothetical protein
MNGSWNFKAGKKTILNPLPLLMGVKTGCVSPMKTVKGCGEVITSTVAGAIITEGVEENPRVFCRAVVS